MWRLDLEHSDPTRVTVLNVDNAFIAGQLDHPNHPMSAASKSYCTPASTANQEMASGPDDVYGSLRFSSAGLGMHPYHSFADAKSRAPAASKSTQLLGAVRQFKSLGVLISPFPLTRSIGPVQMPIIG